MMRLFELAVAFSQVGICAFGGGLSSLPLIEYQLVTLRHWLTAAQFNQVLALSLVTPGPIAINAATFIGFQQAGFWGSVVATLSLTAAPILALSIVIMLLQQVSAERSKKFKFLLRPIVAGLLSLSLVSPLTSTVKNGFPAIGMFILGILLIKFNSYFRENPAILLLLFGIIGAFFLS